MNPIATKRPGVYSQYAVTSLYARPVSERAAALAGVFPEVEGVTRLSRYSEAAALLEGWALAACSLLFGRGVAAVYLSPPPLPPWSRWPRWAASSAIRPRRTSSTPCRRAASGPAKEAGSGWVSAGWTTAPPPLPWPPP